MRLILHDANQFKLKQDLLWVGVSTLATVVIWIVYAIYIAFTQTTVDPEITKLLEPINPTLDESALTRFDDLYLPPDNYTILVKREVNDTSIIVPLGSEVPPELLLEEAEEDEGEVFTLNNTEGTSPEPVSTPPDENLIVTPDAGSATP